MCVWGVQDFHIARRHPKTQEIIMEDKLLEVVSKAEEATAARVCHTCLSCLSFTCASYMTEVLFLRKEWSFPHCLLVFISPVIEEILGSVLFVSRTWGFCSLLIWQELHWWFNGCDDSVEGRDSYSHANRDSTTAWKITGFLLLLLCSCVS
jgi:hypothetical protein